MKNKLTNELIIVSVPKNATDFWINNCGCIRYSQENGMVSSVIEPTTLGFYADNDNYKIIGTITKEICDFDLLDISMDFESFKQQIEIETNYLFENNLEFFDERDYDHDSSLEITMYNNKKIWQQHQDRVFEKLLIIKKI